MIGFIDRVMTSAADRQEEFSAVELGWLLSECVPRLEEEAVGGTGNKRYKVPQIMALKLKRTMTQKQDASGQGDAHQHESFVASSLVEYVSPLLLQQVLTLAC